MMRTFVSICFLLSLSFAHAQLTNEGNGARALGMANATVSSSDVWAAHNNIAGLAEFKGTAGAAAFHNRFGIEGFNTISVAAAHHTDFATAGLSIKRFGDNLYNETVIGIGAAHQIDFVSLGLKANLMQLSIEEIGTKQALALEFGGLVHLNDELTIGANVYNINQAKMATFNDERFSTVLKAGITYSPKEMLNFTLEAEKDVEYNNNVKAGVEYFIIPKLALRTGFSTLNRATSFGLGFQLSKFQVDYGLSLHTQLGVSNAISINYILRKQEKAEKTLLD